MGSTLLEPELERFPNRYRWTVEAANGLREMGVLQGRYEVLDGEIIDKMGQGPHHAITLTKLLRILSTMFRIDCLRIQSPIGLLSPDNTYSEPEPDVAVTRETENAYSVHQPGPDDLLLVVEVADTSLPTDLVAKARLYARAGIVEYWVLDLNDRQLHIHREPKDGFYSSVTVHAETESVALADRPNAPILVGELLPPSV